IFKSAGTLKCLAMRDPPSSYTPIFAPPRRAFVPMRSSPSACVVLVRLAQCSESCCSSSSCGNCVPDVLSGSTSCGKTALFFPQLRCFHSRLQLCRGSFVQQLLSVFLQQVYA